MENENPFPADWAIEIAAGAFNAAPNTRRFVGPVTVAEAKREAAADGHAASIIAHARLIEKFQPELRPIDPLLIEARKIVADVNRAKGFHDWAEKAAAGKNDDGEQIAVALVALRRGKELAA